MVDRLTRSLNQAATIEVSDKIQLERCFSQIKQMSDVLNIRRLAQPEN